MNKHLSDMLRNELESVQSINNTEEALKVLLILRWHTWVSISKGRKYVYPTPISFQQAQVAFNTAYVTDLSSRELQEVVGVYNELLLRKFL